MAERRKRRWSRGRRTKFEETIKQRKKRKLDWVAQKKELALGYMATRNIKAAKPLEPPPAPAELPVPSAFKYDPSKGAVLLVEGNHLRRAQLQNVRLFVLDPEIIK